MKFPDLPRSGFPIIQTILQIINYLRSSRVLSINGVPGRESPNGTVFQIPVGSTPTVSSDTLPPLTPRLRAAGDPIVYTVTVSDGRVNERLPGDFDALEAREIKNIKWGEDAPEGKTADDFREHVITVGQQVTVKVYVDELGALGGDAAPEGFVAELIVEAENEESEHYIPPCGDDTEGTEGVYHYKIAVLRQEEDEAPWFEKFLAGSHISHFRELPLIDNYDEAADDGLGRVVGKYDSADNKYKFRGVRERFGIFVEEEEELLQIDIAAENIGNGNEIYKAPEVEGEDPLPNEKIQFRTIRQMETEDFEDEEITQQIAVTLVGEEEGGGDTIVVHGNGTKGSRNTLSGLIEWNDGLVTSDGDGEEYEGGTIRIHCWKDGVVGYIDLLADGEFTPTV